jgi:uncharacterized surface protein with fasciclin (FAS1) repeats
MRKIQRLAAAGVMAALTVTAGACSNAQGPATGSEGSNAPPAAGAPAAPNPGATPPAGSGVTKASDMFGALCDTIPKDGASSAQEMANEPVATAVSNNPLLSSPDPAVATLAKSVTAANLADTLNSAPALTVFAPANAAFQVYERNNPGALNQLATAPDATSPEGRLANILKYHVVGQRYDAAGLVQAGSLDSLEGAKITIGGTAAAPTVNGAQVACGNIPTKNATVFVITQVLSPPAS